MKQRQFECRFGVGNPEGKHSLIWKVWASRNTADVYVTTRAMGGGTRAMGGSMKASIHASGQRHIGLTSEYAQDKSTRHLERWLGGYELSGDATIEFHIRIPTDELRSFPLSERDLKKNVVWLPPAPESHASLITLLFLAPEARHTPPSGDDEVQLICAGTLADLRQVWLVGATVRDEPFPNQAERFQEMREQLDSAGIVLSTLNDTFRLILGAPFGGVRGWTEMAMSSLVRTRTFS
jgi:hypothetical protein